MRIVTLNEVETDLQNLADQVGAAGFAKAKALYLDKVAVTKEDGTPLSADDLEIVLMPKGMDEEDKAEDEEEKAADAEEDKAEDEEKAVAPKSLSVSRRKAVSGAARMSAPALVRPKVWSKLKNFRDDDRGEAVEKALRFGHWLMASRGATKSLDFCSRNGIEVKAHTEGVNSAGGFLVPDEFETELISLREQFGVFRRNARVRPMGSDTLRIPRRSATLSAKFVGEATAATESTQTFEQVTLVAKKAAVLTTVSNELAEDAFVNLSDDIAGEIAYAFSKLEDQCGFIGDGTSTYGGIQGVSSSVGTAGQFDGDTSGYSGLTAADITSFMSLLPQYADTPNTKFYMHKTVYHAAFENRIVASGGFSGSEFRQGGQPNVLGYPVEFTQVMPSSYADGQVMALFGDLTQACSFGDRRSTTIQISDSALNAFEQDELAIRGTERFDINVHDAGDGSNAGPVVALLA